MRTQPSYIIWNLQTHNSRLNKEQILEAAMEEGLDEFFDGLRLCLDKLVTFGVKEVPEKTDPDGQGLKWTDFAQMAEMLRTRQLTGHAARDAIKMQMDVATQEQWNDWYRRILQKDLKCGVSEKTVNKVSKKLKRPEYQIPVFECMLAHDSANHEKKVAGVKLLEPKLDGVRCITVIDYEAREVKQFTRNGKELVNFTHITSALEQYLDEFGRSYVLDGEIMSDNFQALMKQIHRKSDVKAEDAVLHVFDMLPLVEFKTMVSVMGQRRRSNSLKTWSKIFADTGCVEIVPFTEVDLDSMVGELEFKDYNAWAIEQGYEGIMIKDPDAPYECKRSTSWLKSKPFIEVSLEVIEVEEGTGRNEGRLGAVVCRGTDDGKTITVNCGSGFTDDDRDAYWNCRDSLIGQIVEIRADAVTQNQDGTYSLRFPRFLKFRGFKRGEKL